MCRHRIRSVPATRFTDYNSMQPPWGSIVVCWMGAISCSRESGDDQFLEVFMPVEKFETGAVRQRRRYRETGNWRSLIEDMTQSLEIELASVSVPSEGKS